MKMPATPKLLVCDDDAINLEVVRELFQDDYVVASVDSGEACLGTLAASQPNVVALAAARPCTNSISPTERSSSGPSGRYIELVSMNTVDRTL